MIDSFHNTHTLRCDVCDGEIGDYDDFWDAVNAKKAKGMKSRKIGDDWVDYCRDCWEGRKDHE